MSPKNLRYVIIGTGVAGMAAAEAIRSQDQLGEIILISDEPHRFYSRPGLAYFLTKEIPESQLFPHEKNYLKTLKIQHFHGKVKKISPEEQILMMTSGKSLRYDKLLIATGAKAYLPNNVPGAELEGVVKLNTLNDARKITKISKKAKRAVVIGSGITALEIVEGLIAHKVKVHLFIRGDRYWARVLDQVESEIVEDRLRHEGVKIHYRTEIDSIIGKRGKVAEVLTKDSKSMKVNMVAFGVGIRPRTALAAAATIAVERGIMVNEYMETSHADIFSAGDVAQVFDPLSGKSVLDSLWGPARLQGHTAGLNMAGVKKAYEKAPPFNVTRLAGLTTTIIGELGQGEGEDMFEIVRGESETWHEIPEAIACQSNFNVNRLRLMVGEKTLLGALVMGDQTLSEYLQEIITNQIDISSIRNQLIHPSAALGDVIKKFTIQYRASHAEQNS